MTREDVAAGGELSGCTVLVTRAAEQGGGLTEALRRRGARVVECPVIGFADPKSWEPVDQAASRLGSYDRIVFTSANAVERFLGRLGALGRSPEEMRGARVAAIGGATAAGLRARGLEPGAVAAAARAEGLIELLESLGGLAGSRILLPRAAVAREVLPEALRRAGATVDVVAVYRTVPVPVGDDVRALLARRAVDAAAFTSGSTVTRFLEGAGGAAALAGVLVAVLGPVTAAAARGQGLRPDVVAANASMASLAEAIARLWTSSRRR